MVSEVALANKTSQWAAFVHKTTKPGQSWSSCSLACFVCWSNFANRSCYAYRFSKFVWYSIWKLCGLHCLANQMMLSVQEKNYWKSSKNQSFSETLFQRSQKWKQLLELSTWLVSFKNSKLTLLNKKRSRQNTRKTKSCEQNK